MTNPYRTIFLGDEDEDHCIIFLEALHELKSSVEVVVSRNGPELMENLEKRIPPLPYVLFLDWRMAQKNNLQRFWELKRLGTLKELPVVILSNSVEIKDINAAYNLGANYYMPRPERFSQLVERIEKILLADTLPTERTPKQEFILQS